MEEEFPELDEKSLRKVTQIDRAIKRLDREDQGAFMAITNALEFHLEISPRDPETIRLLASALQRFVASRRIDACQGGFEKPLLDLVQYNGGS